MINFISRKNIKSDQLKFITKDKSNNIYFLGKVVSTSNTLLQLTSLIKGLGLKRRLFLFSSLFGFGFSTIASLISDSFFLNFQSLIRKLYVGSFIKKQEFKNLFLRKKIKIYQALRYFTNLPVRGQRSKTNAGTIKRLRIPVIVSKKDSSKSKKK